MSKFLFEALDLEGAYIIQSAFSEDNRGSFVKYFEGDIFEGSNLSFHCSEAFVTASAKFVVRGLHFQTFHPQAKLINVVRGKVYDVLVDLRKESRTFGQWRGVYLSAENRMSLYIPRGFAHGFISLNDDSMVNYQCDGRYDKQTDTGIRFDDPEIGIEWPINDVSQTILSVRDRRLMSFSDFKKNCSFIYD